jgi:hypothetical protein
VNNNNSVAMIDFVIFALTSFVGAEMIVPQMTSEYGILIVGGIRPE